MQLAVTLIPYVAVGLSIIVFLGLFYGLHQSMQKLRSRVAKVESLLAQTTASIQATAALKQRIDELETGVPAVEVPLQRTGGLNGTVRSKVLKMHRLGQAPERIADSLRLPRGEVDLLVKVHQIVMRPYEEVAGNAGEGQLG